MSYQSFLKSTAMSPTPSSIHRKPPATPSSSLTSAVSPTATSTSKTSTPGLSVKPSFTSASSTSSAAILPPPAPPAEHIPSRSNDESIRTPLSKAQIDGALNICLDLQNNATKLHGKRPFAALLLGPDNTTVLLSHFSISHVQHAETELARLATIHFSEKHLATCTLVSTWEPCAMCAGTIYWSNIGRIVYAASEERLRELTGGNNEENMTMSLPCRAVLKAGQKFVEVIGPVRDWEERVAAESEKWWTDHRITDTNRVREGSVNGQDKPGSLSSVRQGTPTTWTGEDTVLSRIDDEGEYKAELDIDWMR